MHFKNYRSVFSLFGENYVLALYANCVFKKRNVSSLVPSIETDLCNEGSVTSVLVTYAENDASGLFL